MDHEEEPLAGNSTAGLVRIGDTLRRPAGEGTAASDAVLQHLYAVGFTAAPRPLGLDEQGRQVLEYVSGEVCEHTGPLTLTELTSIGRLLADLHDALKEFIPPAGTVWACPILPDREELVCHNDVAPWNLVRSERGWVLIDWDFVAQGSRLWDLSYAAQSMAGLEAGRSPDDAAVRLRAFTDGYAPDDELRHGLPTMLGRRARAMYDLLREGAEQQRRPWARIWTEDGPYWQATTDYLTANADVWERALS